MLSFLPLHRRVLSLLLVVLPSACAFYEYGSNSHALRKSADFKQMVTNSSYLVMVQFYRESCGFCKLLVEPWEKAATDLKHMVHFCSIDVEKDRALSSKVVQKYGIKVEGVPTVVAFTPKSKMPLPYNGERTASAIKAWASSTMPDFVTRLSPKSFDSWSHDGEDQTRKIILFSEKAAPATLIKAISSAYRERVSFGLAQKGTFAEQAKQYGVESYPSLVALRRPADGFEEDVWLDKNFGGKQFSVLSLAGATKPTFRSLEFWVMPFARAPRTKKAKSRKKAGNAEL